MVEAKDIDEETFVKLSGIVKDLRHEIGGPLSVLYGYHEIHSDDHPAEADPEVRELGNFIENAVEADSYAEHVARIPEENVDWMLDYLDNSSEQFDSLEEKLGMTDRGVNLENNVKRIAEATRDTYAYQRRLEGDPLAENISVGELLEPLEDSFDNLSGRKSEISADFSYTGLENEKLDADSGLRLVTWTLGKNWEEHAFNGTDDLEVGFEVSETDCFYDIDLWDTGEGLYTEFPGEGKGSELRYRQASELFRLEEQDAGGGHGLPMAREISDLYESQIFYSEEMLDERGFGIRLKVPNY